MVRLIGSNKLRQIGSFLLFVYASIITLFALVAPKSPLHPLCCSFFVDMLNIPVFSCSRKLTPFNESIPVVLGFSIPVVVDLKTDTDGFSFPVALELGLGLRCTLALSIKSN